MTDLKARVEFYQAGNQRIDTGWCNSYDTTTKEDDYVMSSLSNWEMYISVQSDDGSVIVPADRDFTLEIPSVYVYMYRDTSGSSVVYEPTKFSPSIISVAAYDANGNNYELTDAVITGKYRSGTEAISIKIECPALDVDIVSFTVRTSTFSMSKWFNYASGYNYRLYAALSPISGPVATVTSEEAGLLKSILGNLSELPNVLFDKLKGFFLPDDDYLADYKENWDILLEEHFGALYQAIDIFSTMVESITAEGESQNSITIPVTTINLVGTDFNFGGWEVPLVPDRFQFLVDMLKTLLSIVFTVGFIYMLKNKYYEVMSK